MQLLTFAVDTEATFTSTERVRYYIKVSVHRVVVLLLHCIMYTLYVSKLNNAYQRQFAYFILGRRVSYLSIPVIYRQQISVFLHNTDNFGANANIVISRA